MLYGVDFSISCPCVCKLAPNQKFADSKFKFLSSRKRDVSAANSNIQCELHKSYKTEQERYDHISNTMIQFIETEQKFLSDAVTVIIEDYALGAKGRVFNIAECTGLFKHKVHRNGWHMITIPPTVIKKFATGKGNADKEKMYRAFLSRDNNPELVKFYYDKTDVKIASPVSDIVDAYFVALCGADQLNRTLSTSV